MGEGRRRRRVFGGWWLGGGVSLRRWSGEGGTMGGKTYRRYSARPVYHRGSASSFASATACRGWDAGLATGRGGVRMRLGIGIGGRSLGSRARRRGWGVG